MAKNYLLLWFEAPLQSWGSDSKFGRRETQLFPTKSGVFGLILSAMGAKGEQTNLLQQLNKFSQTIIGYQKKEDLNNFDWIMGSEISSTPLLLDFHMVGSGYTGYKDPWYSLLIPRKSDGKFAVGGGAKITYRYYLQDARFAVIQEVNQELSKQISYALQYPVHEVFFGRKNCIPSDFIFRGTFKSLEDAEQAATQIADHKSLEPNFIVSESIKSDDELILKDVPLQFGDWKKYEYRRVYITNL